MRYCKYRDGEILKTSTLPIREGAWNSGTNPDPETLVRHGWKPYRRETTTAPDAAGIEVVKGVVVETRYRAEPVPPTPAELRAEAYAERADSMFHAWQKCLATGDARADAKKKEWLAEIEKINEEYPDCDR